MRTVALVPSFWSSASLARVSHFARLLFVGLIAASDEHGNVPYRPERLSTLLFPHDSVSPEEIRTALSELQEAGCICHHQTPGGTDGFWVVVNASRYQKIARLTLGQNQSPKRDDEEPELPGMQGTYRFRRPSLEEIRLHGKAMGLGPAECDGFFHYYESVGWVVGRSRKPMRNWLAALQNWRRMNEARIREKETPRLRPSDEIRLIREELDRLADQLRVERDIQQRVTIVTRRRQLFQRLQQLRTQHPS